MNGYWCPRCKKVFHGKVTADLPNATIRPGVVVLVAWLHHLIGVSVNNIVRILNFRVSERIKRTRIARDFRSNSRRPFRCILYAFIGRDNVEFGQKLKITAGGLTQAWKRLTELLEMSFE